ncbi:hypothetical protein WA026_016125, partial [Henosepilachna vigintioctopunctata]
TVITLTKEETVIASTCQDDENTVDIERPSTSGLQSKSQQKNRDEVENSIMDIKSVSNKRQIHFREPSPSLHIVEEMDVTDNTQKLFGQQEAMSTEEINQVAVLVP